MELPWQVREILASLRAAGHEAYAVGGCVRDGLRGVPPHDWDLCTSALPGQVEAALGGRFGLARTGQAHGTLTVLAGGMPVEVTTFRADGPYPDHRRPAGVRLGVSLAEDLARRDLTINAMALSPEGGVIDPFGGRADLAAGLVRCVGRPEQRFAEDALRILRALRFAAQLGFSLEPATLAAARRQKRTLAWVAAERVGAELDRLLTGPGAGQVLEGCGDILAVPLPEITPALGFELKSPAHDRDLWGHTAAAVGAAPPVRQVRWALLLHDLAKPACFWVDENGVGHAPGHGRLGEAQAGRALARLRLEKSLAAAVLPLVRHHDEPLALSEAGARRWLARLGPQGLAWLLEVKRADLAAHAPGPETRRRGRELERFAALAENELARGACVRRADLAVKGRDLLAAGLYRPGPAVGRALQELFEQVLEGALPNDKAALLAWAAEHPAPQSGGT